MPTTDTVHIGQLNVVQIKTDPATGRRIAMARVPSGQRLFEWREDGTAVPVTPVDKAVHHWTVHSNRVLAHHTNATEVGPIYAYDLGDARPAGVALNLPAGTLIGSLMTDGHTIIAGMGLKKDIHTRFFVQDWDLRQPPRLLRKSVGGVAMATSIVDDTVVIAEAASADQEGFFNRRLIEVDLSSGEKTYEYQPAMYNYWRSSKTDERKSHGLMAFNDFVTAYEVAPDGELVPNQYVGIFMRDRDDRDAKPYQLTGTRNLNEPDPRIRFPDDRLPVHADLSPCGWLPGEAKRLLVFAQNGEHTALYICNADNSGVTRVRIPDGLNVESVTEPGNALSIAASHFLSPDRMMVRFSGHRHKPGWHTVNTVTGEVSAPPEGFSEPEFDPESPEYVRGKTWIPEEKRYREYTLFLPPGMTVEKAKAQGGIGIVKYEFGGPHHAQAGVYSAEPKRYTQLGVGFVVYTRRGSTTLGTNDYPYLAKNGFLKPGERDGEALMDHLVDEDIAHEDGLGGAARSHGAIVTLLAAVRSKHLVAVAVVAPCTDIQVMGEDAGVPVRYADDADRAWTQARRERAAAHPAGYVRDHLWIGQAYANVYLAPSEEALDDLPARNAHLNKIPTLVIAHTDDIRSAAKDIHGYVTDVNEAGGNAVYIELGGGHRVAENGHRGMVDMAAFRRGEAAVPIDGAQMAAEFVVDKIKASMARARAREELRLVRDLALNQHRGQGHHRGVPLPRTQEPGRDHPASARSLCKGLDLGW